MQPYTSPIPDRTGSVISSGNLRLQLKSIIGTGPFGIVYLAQDTDPKFGEPASSYAVKMLMKEPEAVQQREIAYLRSLGEHPHITKLHTVIEDEEYVYLVMDYYSGGDLFDAIVDRGEFEQNDKVVRTAFLQVLDAVQACHEQGVCHRDVCIENIMCSAELDKFYLGDFGLSSGTDVSEDAASGNLWCMSPETLVWYHRRTPFAAPHADVWALGIVLVNMISGECPWESASADDDEEYAAYLVEGPSYFERTFGMSAASSELVAGILEVDVSKRMKLNEIRDAVNGMQTFFDSPSDSASEVEILLTDPCEPSVKRPSLVTTAAMDELYLVLPPPSVSRASQSDGTSPRKRRTKKDVKAKAQRIKKESIEMHSTSQLANSMEGRPIKLSRSMTLVVGAVSCVVYGLAILYLYRFFTV